MHDDIFTLETFVSFVKFLKKKTSKPFFLIFCEINNLHVQLQVNYN